MLNKRDCAIAFGLCLIFAVILKFSYKSNLEDERLKHSGAKDFLPVVATAYKIDEYQKEEYGDFDYDDDYEYRYVTKYNITYQYKVADSVYYITYYDEDSVKHMLNLYYNPDNPQVTPFFF